MYDKNNIAKYVERGARINTSSERSFRESVVGNLLEAMGWDMGNEEEVATYLDIQVGTQTPQADYLIKNGISKFILEVKQPNHEIEGNMSDYSQTHSYSRLTSSPFGVLYNGRKLIVFRDSSKQPVYVWRYISDPENLLVFECLAKENFPDMLEEFLLSQEKYIKLQNYVDDNSEKITTNLVKLISTNTSLDPEFVNSHLTISITFDMEREATETPENSRSDDLVLIRQFRDYGPGTGLDFVRNHKAWGFIRVGIVPRYLALYDVDNKELSKLYVVKGVEELSQQNFREFQDHHSKSYLEELRAGRYKILRLGEAVQIRPIPKGRKPPFRGGKITSLLKIKNAKTMDDL